MKLTVIDNHARGRICYDILGINNSISINSGTSITNLNIYIRGDGNRLIIDENCNFGSECSFWLVGDNNTIRVGKNSTFTWRCHLNVSERNMTIDIGEDCMFSNHIIVRTSDDHKMIDVITGERINPAKDVKIGNHVWIAPNTKIMKGAIIPDGCIIGSDSTVSKVFDTKNSLIVGRPAKVVKSNVSWTRESVF